MRMRARKVKGLGVFISEGKMTMKGELYRYLAYSHML